MSNIKLSDGDKAWVLGRAVVVADANRPPLWLRVISRAYRAGVFNQRGRRFR